MPLDSLHKKPYEVLVLGRVRGDVKETLRYARIFMVNVFLEAARILFVYITCSHLLAYCGPKNSLNSFGIRECFSEVKGWKPLSVLHICLCLGTGSDKSLVDRASFADRFSWTMSPWHRLMPFWGHWCFSTRENIQDYIVCSQWLCMAIVNPVLSKISVIS